MATIKDVAKLAQVGVGTVSRYLSGRGGVSEKSELKVREAMRQLNYRPNSLARALSTQRSNLIGLWLPSLSGPFYQQLIEVIEYELRQYGKHLILANVGGACCREVYRRHLEDLIHRDCDGILMACPELLVDDMLQTQQPSPPLVLINHASDRGANHSFSVDHYAGGRIAAQSLLAAGHQRIACISGRLSAQDAQLRQRGFLDELARQGQPIDPELLIDGRYDFAGGRLAVQHLLSKGRHFDALFCGNDKVALVALSELQARGLRIPEDVAVLGYDNVDFAAVSSPPLSTIAIPIEQMALAASRQVLNLAYQLELPIPELAPPRYVARQSTRPATDTVTDN
ncbi:LacI family DNA-binding transcriptional regulator [Aliagarivorans marinus]|uniref:LacI family DNA-binding transcriptional regulator n=1 Tax=Aliagarivorans marinus TaxID=561965 RepID=UPI000414674A|nr:LacI family DNA-binding transcriptional regulator [Aliagarivorans marinus]